MIMQVFCIQGIRDDLKLLAMDVLDLMQGSIYPEHLDTKGQWLVEYSQQ